MTSLVNQPFQNVFADTLTTTNSGQGLSTTLQPLQDGIGNNSTITIATNAVNFNRGGGNTFQLDSVALTAPATNINNICGGTPSFSGSSTPLQLPSFASDPASPEAGWIYYNTTTNQIKAYLNGVGWVTLSHSP